MKKRLIYRLSSLGDVIISMAALERAYPGETHWVVSKELAGFLEGVPGISKVIPFDRKNASVGEWIRLNRSLFRETPYEEIWDLHRTWRTLVARLVFFISARSRGNWKSITKERGKRLGYVLFKAFWPKTWRPRGLRRQILELGDSEWRSLERFATHSAMSRPRIGIAPSSAWPGKEWSAERFATLVVALAAEFEIVLLGTERDSNALKVRELLTRAGVPVESWLGNFNLSELRSHLGELQLVVACDSGLAHLAELAGTPVVTIYGPTRADFGFGPKLLESRVIESPIWCSPCSKDGSLCFRPLHRYKCLDLISPDQVETLVREHFSGGPSPDEKRGKEHRV